MPTTMPALKLLILDANEVIYLHETGLWQAVLSRCSLVVSVRFSRPAGKKELTPISTNFRFPSGPLAGELTARTPLLVKGDKRKRSKERQKRGQKRSGSFSKPRK
jgi:hypothetical protein